MTAAARAAARLLDALADPSLHLALLALAAAGLAALLRPAD